MFNKILPMTGVEPRTSGIEIDRSTNWATTTSQKLLSNNLLKTILGNGAFLASEKKSKIFQQVKKKYGEETIFWDEKTFWPSVRIDFFFHFL